MEIAEAREKRHKTDTFLSSEANSSSSSRTGRDSRLPARGETPLLMLDRWRKLHDELYDPVTGFDISKVCCADTVSLLHQYGGSEGRVMLDWILVHCFVILMCFVRGVFSFYFCSTKNPSPIYSNWATGNEREMKIFRLEEVLAANF